MADEKPDPESVDMAKKLVERLRATAKPELWMFPGGGMLTFTGEFGEGYAGHPSSAPWEPGSDIPAEPMERAVVTASGGRRWVSEPMPVGFFPRLGPKELWETLEDPPGRNPWPEPEADYEALGYPETEAGYEHTNPAISSMAVVDAMHACIEASVALSPITNNQDDVD